MNDECCHSQTPINSLAFHNSLKNRPRSPKSCFECWLPISDFQTLMLPVLRLANAGEIKVVEAVVPIAGEFALTDQERVDGCGSITAARREMGMSDKRAWKRVGALNAMFRDPLVDSTSGGPGGGGAVLTENGRRVLAQ
jgi:molybdate transport repressor ModE-like protein